MPEPPIIWAFGMPTSVFEVIMNTFKAFTLLELLAGIAILAVLLAFLTPTLKSGLEKSREARCSSNLHSIGSFFSLYAADNDGNLLPYVTSHSNSNLLWPDIIVRNYINPSNPTAMDYKSFFCPSLVARGYSFATRSPLGYRTNYAINNSVMASEENAINKLSQFDKPSRTGVIWDGSTWPDEEPRMSVGGLREYHIEAGNPNCSVGWLHGQTEKYPNRYGRANVLFLDGHVESQRDPGNGKLLDIGVAWPNLYP